MSTRGDDRLQVGFEAGATIIDPRPALSLWRGGAGEELAAAEAPTRQSPDVVEALAAHEFSLAHPRRDTEASIPPLPSFQLAPMPELVKWEIDLEPKAAELDELVPTRVQTARGGVPLAPWSMATVVIPRDRFAAWPLRPEPPPPPRSPRVIWQVLLASGLLVSMALAALVIRSG